MQINKTITMVTVTRVVSALIAAAVITLSVAFNGCGTLTTQDVQNGVETAGDILDVVASLLSQVTRAKANCRWMVKSEDDSTSSLAIEFCPDIYDAADHVILMREVYEKAVKEGGGGNIRTARRNLELAAFELKTELEESGLSK